MPLTNKDTSVDIGNNITIIGIILGWLVTILGWFGTIFHFGRSFGTLKTRLDVSEDEIEELKKDTSSSLEGLRKSIDKLLRCFVTADGEPRLVSFSALDKIHASCRKESDIRLNGHDEVLEKHDGKLDDILKGIATLDGKLSNGNGK